MFLAYASRTSNVRRIVEKLGLSSGEILDINEFPNFKLERDFCVLTYTDFLGQIPEVVLNFLKINSGNLKAIAGSGNRNFGENFCGAAKKIREIYDKDRSMGYFEFELSGDQKTIEEFKDFLKNN